MGISFGDDADVRVGGDMVGGDQTKAEPLVFGDRPYHEARTYIMAQDIPLVHKQECVQQVQRMRMEMLRNKPSESAITQAAEALANQFPEVLSALLSAMPGILAAAPAIVDLVS